jgi:hypothetical protein
MMHDVLDGLFNKDINGVTNTTVTNADVNKGTTDTYHYATFYDANGTAIKVSLPTLNGSAVPAPKGIGAYQDGTTVGNATASNGSNAANATYSDLLAIWDAYNGTSTATNTAGVAGMPPGWRSNTYWSATPSASGHAGVFLNDGSVGENVDTNYGYVALQVL